MGVDSWGYGLWRKIGKEAQLSLREYFLPVHTREKQIPLCVPRSPNCGGKENARDSVRDNTQFSLPANCERLR
jgi:hypothetical protein